MLCAALILIRQQTQWLENQRHERVSLRQAQEFFPDANRVQLADPERGLFLVTNARGVTVGALLRTSPYTDQIVGYSGPNDVLIALDPKGAIAGLKWLRWGDTPEHVRKVRDHPEFLRALTGWRPGEGSPPPVEAVSGATLTSFAIVESIRQRLAGSAPSLRFPEPVALADVQLLFANATRIVPEQARWRVLDGGGRLLGFVLRTSPQADNVPGYRGPTECLIGLAPDGQTIRGIHVRKSFETPSYVDQIRRAKSFLDWFVGKRVVNWASVDFRQAPVEGVSGATLTARAITEGVQRRLAAEVAALAPAPAWRPQGRDWALAGVVAGAFVVGFTSLRGRRWIRWTWQLFLIGYVGWVAHDFVSLALWGGWAAHGIAFRSAPGLVLLSAASLLAPWLTRRQVYCHQICPHGAAQQVLGRLGSLLGKRLRRTGRSQGNQPKRPGGKGRWPRWLEGMPGLLLAAGFIGALAGWNVSLASLEPFEAWVWRTASLATLLIAGAGLAAALFLPQAFCRYGCPTGELLGFVRSAGSADHWSRRDWLALAVLAAGASTVIGVRIWPNPEPEPPVLTLRGRTMGTAWSVKIRDEVGDVAGLEKAVGREFDWVESMTSHWQTNTGVSEFNSLLTTNVVAVPWPVVTLSRWASEISRATGGAYDITVGPLVRLWGFGPGPRRADPPSEVEIGATRPCVGWEKLEVLDGMLRKHEPGVQVDFSSIAKGWGIDRVAQLLERRGFTNALVEAGGELRALGPWTVAIEHPTRSIRLNNESIATSGTYRQKFQSDGQPYSHLIDPRSGRPVTHRTVSVSVRHADCAHADAWATALNILGVEAGLPLADQLGLRASFVIEAAHGQIEVRDCRAWRP